MEFKPLFLSLRPTHWLKNILLFMPLLFGKKLLSIDNLVLAFWAFSSFCLLASSIYIFNDLLDKESDSHHPLKKLRSIAKGKIKTNACLLLTGILFLSSLGIGFLKLNTDFLLLCISYFFLGIVYTIWLKQIVILDVVVLSFFYVIRVLAGGAATGVLVSHWMLISVWLLAIFISLHKRLHEIKFLNESKALHREVLSKYDTTLIQQLIFIVSTLTLLIYTFYTIDTETVSHVGNRRLIVTVPFVYFGIFRYLYISQYKNGGGDPVKAFLTDIPSIMNGFFWALLCIWLIYSNVWY